MCALCVVLCAGLDLRDGREQFVVATGVRVDAADER